MKRLIYIALLSLLFLSCDELFLGSDPKADDPLLAFDEFYSQVDTKFSFFSYLSQDFDSAFQINRNTLEENPSPEVLVEALQEMINLLGDGHSNVFLSSNAAISYTGWYDQYPVNTLSDISGYFQNYIKVNQALEYGSLNNNIGYIKVNTFSGSLPSSNYLEIDTILNEFENKVGIIIDVRSNGGGNSNNADTLISRFNDEPRLAFRARRREPSSRDSFGPWFEKLTDVHSGNRFLKPVAVLTNRRSFSSTEWFVSGMRTIPHVTIVGDTTGGGSGNPVFAPLPNGWSMRVSNTQKELPEGRDYQYEGIYPDIPVWVTTENSLAGIDTILERAIEAIRN